jgi:hypothetical protein
LCQHRRRAKNDDEHDGTHSRHRQTVRCAKRSDESRLTHADCEKLKQIKATDLPRLADELAERDARLIAAAAALRDTLDAWQRRLEEAYTYNAEQLLAYNRWLWETVAANVKNAATLAEAETAADALRTVAKVVGPRDRKDMTELARSLQDFSSALSTLLERWTGVDKLMKLSARIDAERAATIRKSKKFIAENRAALDSILTAHRKVVIDRQRIDAYQGQVADALQRDCGWMTGGEKRSSDGSSCKKGLDRCDRNSDCCTGCCNGYFNMCGTPKPCSGGSGKMCCPI